MTWVATAVIGSAVIGAVGSSIAGDKANDASQAGTNASIAEQRRQYDLTRQDFAPQRSLGTSATDQLARLYGFSQPSQANAAELAQQPVAIGDSQLPAGTTTRAAGNGWYDVLLADGTNVGVLRPGGASGKFVSNGAPIPANNAPNTVAPAPQAGAPDMGAFTASPDYQFNLAEGQKGLDRSLVARGRSLSGAGAREGIRYASGMASNEYSNFTNRLLTMAGLGNSATQSTAQAGMVAANNNSSALLNNANNRASGYLQTGANINNAVQSGIGNFLLQRYLTPSGTAGGGQLVANNYAGPKYGGYA